MVRIIIKSVLLLSGTISIFFVAPARADRAPELELVCQTTIGDGRIFSGLESKVPLFRCDNNLGKRGRVKYYSSVPGKCFEYEYSSVSLGSMQAVILNTVDTSDLCVSPSRSIVSANLTGKFLLAQYSNHKKEYSVCNASIDASVGSTWRTSLASLVLNPDFASSGDAALPDCTTSTIEIGKPLSMQVKIGGRGGAGFGCKIKVAK